MRSLETIEEPARCHLSINVTNLKKSIAFYKVLFGKEPSKCHDDYAKFDVDNPPAVFALVPGTVGHGGPLSHMGLRLTNEADVRVVQRRLEAAGIVTRNQTNTRGCYALQTKVWVEDPDQNLWEIYIVKEDLPHGSAYGSCADSFDDLEDNGEQRLVIYKGPFRELIDEDGRRFPRGADVLLPARAWERLRQGPAAAQFVFSVPAPKTSTAPCSGSCG
jgi:catechol 2,3-dioxygenase-like lactoylglutathione lyase family enzyme